MNDRSALKALIDVAQVLESLGVRFHIGGSMASAVHGEPRQARGIDLVVDISQQQARELVRRLADRYYGDEDRAAEAVHRRRAFNLIELQDGFKLDLFCLGDSAFDRTEFERAVALDLGDPPEIRVRVQDRRRHRAAQAAVVSRWRWPVRPAVERCRRHVAGLSRHDRSSLPAAEGRRVAAQWMARSSRAGEQRLAQLS